MTPVEQNLLDLEVVLDILNHLKFFQTENFQITIKKYLYPECWAQSLGLRFFSLSIKKAKLHANLSKKTVKCNKTSLKVLKLHPLNLTYV